MEEQRRAVRVLSLACILAPFVLGIPLRLQAVDLAPGTFGKEVSSLISQTKYEAGFWGIHIVSLKQKRVLYSLNASKRFPPASNVKLATGAAVLDRFGPEYRFETPVYGEGRVDAGGRLLGNLVLVGSGDPNLESRVYRPEEEVFRFGGSGLFIEKVADEILQRGIVRVEGDIVADDTVFVYEPFGRSWEHKDLQWAYGAPASALAVNENVYAIQLSPGERVDDPAWVRVTPFLPVLQLTHRLSTVGKGRAASFGIERDLDRAELVVQGELPLEGSTLDYYLAVEDPAEYAAMLLKAALEKRGISVAGRAVAKHVRPLDILEGSRPSPDWAKALRSHYAPEQQLVKWQSGPLIETLKVMMKISHNLYAEVLFRKLGEAEWGIGCIESGSAAVKSFLERADVANQEVNLDDGSGMSRTDQLTPRAVVRLLEYMDRHAQGRLFFETLPVAGVDGTLRHRMERSPAQGRIHAKTGTLGFVNTLSGYALTANGDKLAFSVMASNHSASLAEVRGTIDQICVLMARYNSAID